jgi:hypothetical protein
MQHPLIKGFLATVALAAAVSLAGCVSAPQNPYMTTGAGLGGAVGAAIGAGTNGRDPWKGAAIGGLLGAATGAVGGEVYRQATAPQQPGYNQYGPQPGYGYPPPNQGYNRRPNYGPPPAYGQYGPPSYSQSGPPAYEQNGPPSDYYSPDGPQ